MSEPTYPGPRNLGSALSQLHVERGEQAVFQREGLRADSEYRDLGLAAVMARS